MARITKDNTKEINSLTTNVAVMLNMVQNVDKKVDGICTKLEEDYASKEWVDFKVEKFVNTTKVVNGILVAFGLAIVGALANFILKGGLK